MAARLAALALGLAVALAPAAAYGADPDLGGEWHLDQLLNFDPQTQIGQTPDSSGKGNDLDSTPGVTVVPDGRFASAFDFSQGGHLNRSGGASLQPQTAVTMMAWVRSSAQPGDVKYVAAEGGTSNCNGSDSYALYTGASPNGNRLEFYITTTDQGLVESPRAPSTIWDGQWHAVDSTYDGAMLRFYVDGSEIGSGTPATAAI